MDKVKAAIDAAAEAANYKRLASDLQKEVQGERKISILLACIILILLVYIGGSGP